jgi:hypothetical protein
MLRTRESCHHCLGAQQHPEKAAILQGRIVYDIDDDFV